MAHPRDVRSRSRDHGLGGVLERQPDSVGRKILLYDGPPKPIFLEVFMVNNLVFRWPKPLFFMVLGAHGSFSCNMKSTQKFKNIANFRGSRTCSPVF